MKYQELKALMKEQREEMTPSERMRAYCSGQEVDYIPYSLLGADQAIAEVLGYTTSQSADFEITKDIIEKKYKEFGLEGLNVGLGLRTLGAALGSELVIPEHGIDYVKTYVLTDYNDFDKIKSQNPYKNEKFLRMLDYAKRLKDHFPDMDIATGVTGPISTAAAIRPIELILRDTVKKPDMLKELLDLSVEHSLVWVEMFCKEFGPVATGFSDPVTCMDVLSKRQFDKFSGPYLEKLIKGLEEITGMKPSAHICGKTKPIWGDLKRIGLSSFSIDNCEDLEEAKCELGGEMQIVGNVPPVEVMRNGTIDDVINSCKNCILKGGDSPNGFQLDTGCQVPLGTPRENMEAFIYAARKYGRGAKKGYLPKGLDDIT